MSRFKDAFTYGADALMDQCGDAMEYWPLGVEDDAFDLDVIWTDLMTRDSAEGRGIGSSSLAEVQIWADDARGIEAVTIKSDLLVRNTVQWRVMAILETVGGMHRLTVERCDRSVVGRGRGAR